MCLSPCPCSSSCLLTMCANTTTTITTTHTLDWDNIPSASSSTTCTSLPLREDRSASTPSIICRSNGSSPCSSPSLSPSSSHHLRRSSASSASSPSSRSPSLILSSHKTSSSCSLGSCNPMSLFSFNLVSPLIAILLIVSGLIQLTEACSSRSTPKPRPPSPTSRPNITFQTYACPEAYAKWYCLNGATCFSVRIGESILYNCECADGYMGQRCEFKDLDGSYLPARERLTVERAGFYGGAAVAIVFAVIFVLLKLAITQRVPKMPASLSPIQSRKSSRRSSTMSCPPTPSLTQVVSSDTHRSHHHGSIPCSSTGFVVPMSPGPMFTDVPLSPFSSSLSCPRSDVPLSICPESLSRLHGFSSTHSHLLMSGQPLDSTTNFISTTQNHNPST